MSEETIPVGSQLQCIHIEKAENGFGIRVEYRSKREVSSDMYCEGGYGEKKYVAADLKELNSIISLVVAIFDTPEKTES